MKTQFGIVKEGVMGLAQDLIDAAKVSVNRVTEGIEIGEGEFASLVRKNDADCALKLVQAYVTLQTGARR